MSRVANSPIKLPKGVEVKAGADGIIVKGAKTSLTMHNLPGVSVTIEDGVLRVQAAGDDNVKFAGTARALLASMVEGVTKGYERKLELAGVGFRAAAQGRKLNLTLGFSHPIDYAIPDGITIETPSPTEIVVKGADKQAVGQVAAKIRAFRPPEPYKGKGVHYTGEHINRKEAKKA